MFKWVKNWWEKRHMRNRLRLLNERAARAIVILEGHPELTPPGPRPADMEAVEADPNIHVEEW